MQVTAELSLYPLTKDYESPIISFIQHLKNHSEIQVNTHAMSTFVKGNNSDVFNAISNSLEIVNKEIETVSLVIKVITRDLPVEKGFLNFS
ncbi:MAG: hypothetical protein HKN51_13420 [Saprospiraceae bacterium]|nr:thiamine-binding protein [Bacteroidia bacterium]NNE15978.1 hypothetical protein [Saprospiraceae bacterium]